MNIGIYIRSNIELEGLASKTLDANSSINIFDEYGLEEGLRLKESNEDIQLTCIFIGKPEEKDIVSKVLALNVDKAIHIHNQEILSVKDEATILEKIFIEEKFDLLITGAKDSATGEFGLAGYLSELLDYNYDTNAIDIILKDENLQYKKKGNYTSGYEMCCKLPMVIGIGKGNVTLRYATLKGIMAAKRKPYSILEMSNEERNKSNVQFGNINETSVLKENKIYCVNEDEYINTVFKVIDENVKALS